MSKVCGAFVCALASLMILATSVTLAPGPRVSAEVSHRSAGQEAYGNLPLTFEANVGQSDPSVAFLARSRGYTAFLTPTEVVTEFNPGPAVDDGRELRMSLPTPDGVTTFRNSASRSSVVLRTQFIGTSPLLSIEGLEPQAGKTNYFVGGDPTTWRTNVPNFRQVKYTGIYSGIDVVFYGNELRLEYDFVVSPAGDPRSIEFSVVGANRIAVNDHGDLVLVIAGGEVTEQVPLIYQTIDGLRRLVGGHYLLNTANRVTFNIDVYDHNRTLIIDPVFSYSTYLGGRGDDFPIWSDRGPDGSLYIAGFTSSNNYPTTTETYQPKRGGGIDAFVTKLNPDGSSLSYSTYLGGRGADFAV